MAAYWLDQRPETSPAGEARKRPLEQQFEGEDDLKRRRTDSDAPPSTLRVLIRNSDAGGIIGRSGDNIKRLRKQFDCQVVLPDSPGASERVMTVMGSIPSCVGVLSELLPMLGHGMIQHGEPGAMVECQILIPQPFMGTIIGTGGTKIKELRSRTKATIKIFSEPMPSSNERSIQLMGTSDQISQCVQHFLEEISRKEPREPIFLYEPGMPSGPFGGPGGPGGPDGPPPMRGRGGPPGGPAFRGMRGRGGRGRGFGFEPNGSNQWSPQGMRGRGRGEPPRGGRGRGFSPLGPPGRGGGTIMPSNRWQPPPNVPPNAPPTSMPYGAGPPTSTPAPAPVSQNAPTQLFGMTTPPAQPLFGMNPPSAPQQPMGNYSPAPAAPAPTATPTPGVGYGMNQPPVGYSMNPPNSSQPAAGPTPLVPGYMGGQAPQQALPTATPSSSAPQYVSQPTSQQVTIPNEYAMAILGPNAARLQQIKAQSSCEITLDDLKPGSVERIITITGTPNGIQFAQQLMQNSVREKHPHV